MKRKVGQDIIMRKKTVTQLGGGDFSARRPNPVQPIKKPERQPERIVHKPVYREPEPLPVIQKQKPDEDEIIQELFTEPSRPVVRDREVVRERFQRSLPPSRGGLMWMFAGIAVVALLVTVFSIIARSRISLVLKESRYSIDVPATLYEEPAENQIGFKTATVVDKQSTVVPTTTRDTGGSYARGTIKLFSTATTAVTIPVKTVVTGSTGKKFTIDKKITLPAGMVKKPSSADVTITATEPGDTYNIGRDDFTFEKLTTVVGHSVDDISGGSSSGNYTLSPDVLTATQQQLITQMKLRDPSVYLSKQIPGNFLLLSTLTQASDITFTSQSVNTGVEVTAQRTITGNMIEKSAVQQFLRWNGIPETEQTFMTPTDISLVQITLGNNTTAPATTTDTENKTLAVHIAGSFTARAEFNQADILPKIVHQKKKDAKKILENTPGIIKASITMWPPWIGKIPNRASAISILTSFGVSA